MKEIIISVEDRIHDILTLRAKAYGVSLEEFIETALIEGALVGATLMHEEGAH